MTSFRDIRIAYEEGLGQWTGCSWPTSYGCLGLNLDGISSRLARKNANRWCAIAADKIPNDELTTGEEASLVDMAEHQRLRRAVMYSGEDQERHLEVRGKSARLFCAAILAGEWQYASRWLKEIEADAFWAEGEAQKAVTAAEQGDWDYALQHACQACSIESGYDNSRPWRHLRQLIEEAAKNEPGLTAALLEQ
jgi:hypothetical protein